MISNLFIIFFMKRFHKHKNTSLRSLCTHEKLLPLLFSFSLFLFLLLIFVYDVFLCTWNLFLKKKIIRLEIVLITSLCYTARAYLCQPTYWEFIWMHLFLFVIIWENLFFLWESFWISSYLWSSGRIYFFKSLWK